MKNTYLVRCYEATLWSFFSQADHFTDHKVTTAESPDHFVARLLREGLRIDESTCIMPGAILRVEKI